MKICNYENCNHKLLFLKAKSVQYMYLNILLPKNIVFAHSTLDKNWSD